MRANPVRTQNAREKRPTNEGFAHIPDTTGD
jgi:hypothetical protein